MCIPNILLCTNEISLLRKQRNIESLTLHTEFNCSLGVGSSSVDLAHFPKLRSLSWKGLNKYSDFECLKDWIRVHGHRIVSLTLDLVSWHRAKKIWTDGLRQQSDKKEIDNFLTHSVLSAKAEDERIMFQALEYLDLSAISFEHADTEMPLVFRIENLKTLKLRKCIESQKWLELVSSSRKLTKLKYFELFLTSSEPKTTTKKICDFIERAPRLEALCLMLCEPIDWDSIMRTVRRCSSLTRFSMHSLVDQGMQGLITRDIPWPSGLEQLLQDKQLAFFGTSTPPRELVSTYCALEHSVATTNQEHKASQLQNLQARPLCKLLHIRATGMVMMDLIYDGYPVFDQKSVDEYCDFGKRTPIPKDNGCRGTDSHTNIDPSYEPRDIHKFAEWAFSSDGLPNLIVLAYGDFSHENHYWPYNMFLYNTKAGYRRYDPAEILRWDLVNDNIDMLAACPFEDITDLESDGLFY